MDAKMKRRLLLWGEFRLEPSRLVPVLSAPRPEAAPRTADRAAAARVARLEQQLEKQGVGLGV